MIVYAVFHVSYGIYPKKEFIGVAENVNSAYDLAEVYKLTQLRGLGLDTYFEGLHYRYVYENLEADATDHLLIQETPLIT